MEKPKVYSYLRFSDPKQAAGSSAERQAAYAERWAADRGMELDAALSMRDEGLSAYHQAHVAKGALGAFLRSIEDGLVAPGSVLIVEGLDRLSRAEPVLAQAQLAQIVNAGITVVTASDGKEYNRERLKAQPMDLVYSLLVMIRAHEESDTKSKRVKAAIRRQCAGWQAGTWRGIIRNGHDPAWVRWTGSAFELIPDRAEMTRAAIDLFLCGRGAKRVINGLIEQGHDPAIFPGNQSSFYRILKSPALIGIKRIAVDGEDFALEGYYPRLLDDDTYNRLIAAGARRVRRHAKGEIPGIITGIGRLYCGYCGAAVVGQNLMSRNRKPDGTPQDGHRRLICCGNSLGIGCDVGGSVSVVPVERALLEYCADQINLGSLYADDSRLKAARGELARARARIATTEKQLDRITAALLADDDAAPATFARKARDLEADLAEARREETLAEAELNRAARMDAPAEASRWQAIKTAALDLDHDARLQARQLVAETFARIVLYHRSTTPGESHHVDLTLIAHGGAARMLRIDRKTGAWTAEENFSPDAK